jgi:hypothetical protein
VDSSYTSWTSLISSAIFHLVFGSLWPKVGAILKKSVDCSDTDSILPRESIDKAIVSLQIPEVLNDEAIQVL